jgi:hypothetical protein
MSCDLVISLPLRLCARRFKRSSWLSTLSSSSSLSSISSLTVCMSNSISLSSSSLCDLLPFVDFSKRTFCSKETKEKREQHRENKTPSHTDTCLVHHFMHSTTNTFKERVIKKATIYLFRLARRRGSTFATRSRSCP